MIVCSCNVLSDTAIRAVLDAPHPPTRVLDVYRQLGCRPQCGCCAGAILRILRETADACSVASEAATAAAA